MLKFLKFAAAMVLLAGWALAALSLHVVRTAGGVHLIPKNELSLADTYVDVSQWTREDEDKHATLYARLKQLDQTNLLEASAEDAGPEVASEKPATAVARSYNSDIKKAWDRALRTHR